eukprot:2059790-Amphidinium_carterae.1
MQQVANASAWHRRSMTLSGIDTEDVLMYCLGFLEVDINFRNKFECWSERAGHRRKKWCLMILEG